MNTILHSIWFLRKIQSASVCLTTEFSSSPGADGFSHQLTSRYICRYGLAQYISPSIIQTDIVNTILKKWFRVQPGLTVPERPLWVTQQPTEIRRFIETLFGRVTILTTVCASMDTVWDLGYKPAGTKLHRS